MRDLDVAHRCFAFHASARDRRPGDCTPVRPPAPVPLPHVLQEMKAEEGDDRTLFFFSVVSRATGMEKRLPHLRRCCPRSPPTVIGGDSTVSAHAEESLRQHRCEPALPCQAGVSCDKGGQTPTAAIRHARATRLARR